MHPAHSGALVGATRAPVSPDRECHAPKRLPRRGRPVNQLHRVLLHARVQAAHH